MEKIRLGVIGVGSVVRQIYQNLYFKSRYSDIISVEAICDVSEESIAWFADSYKIPRERCFGDYTEMIRSVELDAVAVNTPDSMHCRPVVDALDSGLDVLLAKPLADKVADAHEMIEAVARTARFLGVDFHKRHDPRIMEAATRFAGGNYGNFQLCVWYMINRLSIVDPNYEPRFFASADYAEKNSPVTFLTVHAVDSFLFISGLKPVQVRATGYKQKLRSLKPISVDGYDLVDTEVRFSNGGVGHFVTGWHLPNTAHTAAVQSARFICTDGMIDLALDAPGYHEIVHDGIFERNPLFQNLRPDGLICGYGMSSPGKILENILTDRSGALPADVRESLLGPLSLGFYTTLICHGAHESLDGAAEGPDGVFAGEPVNLEQLLIRELGKENAERYL